MICARLEEALALAEAAYQRPKFPLTGAMMQKPVRPMALKWDKWHLRWSNGG